MRESLNKAAELLFRDLPFSRKSEELKEEMTNAAYLKYDAEVAEGVSEAEAAGHILIHAGDVEELCACLGIGNGADAGKTEEPGSEEAFLKAGRTLRRNSRVLALEITCITGAILNPLLYFTLPVLITAAVSLPALGFLIIYTLKRRKKLAEEDGFYGTARESACRKMAEERHDFYSKKLINSIFMAFSLSFLILFSILLSVTASGYRPENVVSEIRFYQLLVETMVYILLKNIFCRRMWAGFFGVRREREYAAELRRICAFSAFWYTAFLILLLLVRNRTERALLFGEGAAALYFVLGIFYNYTRRRRFVRRNLRINPRKIICCTLAAVLLFTYNIMKMDLYLTQPYINTVSAVEHGRSSISYDEDTGIYTITTQEESFRILQLTDIHLGGSLLSVSKDLKALKACRELIDATNPDLVVVTGDLVFPMGVMSFSLSNSAPVMQFANFMRNTGIPWAFTYGNHDTEAMATLNRGEFDELMKTLSYKTSENLLYPYVQPDIYGRNNQMIEIRAGDGSLMQALFLIDSNDYVEAGSINEYDYIHDDQVEWYRRMVTKLSEKEGFTVPSMIFIHIPLREYKTANDLYESGSDEVTYYYGILGETMIDKICCSKYESGLFDAAVESGSTKAIFCGHDHYNNQSLEYRGIRLTYGYSIDYLAMPGIENDTEQRGATLITVERDGSFEITPYRLEELGSGL